MKQTRRSLLGGIAAVSSQVLLSRRLFAGSFLQTSSGDSQAAPPGALDLLLTALGPGILRISISPAGDAPRLGELGVVESPKSTTLGPGGRVHPQSIRWGKYTVRVTDAPLHVGVYEGDKLRQEVRLTGTAPTSGFPFPAPSSAWAKAFIRTTAAAPATPW